ncbi:LapA family protein [Shouchella clausii]
MKAQTAFIIGIIAAIIIAVFAVLNVESVPVNLLVVKAQWPLILVILGSVLLGAIVAGMMSLMKVLQLNAEIKRLRTAKQANVDQPHEGSRQKKEVKKQSH